jgi:hypothetical protein
MIGAPKARQANLEARATLKNAHHFSASPRLCVKSGRAANAYLSMKER